MKTNPTQLFGISTKNTEALELRAELSGRNQNDSFEPDWDQETCEIICQKLNSQDHGIFQEAIKTLNSMMNESPEHTSEFIIQKNVIFLLFSQVQVIPQTTLYLFRILSKIIQTIPNELIPTIIPEQIIISIFQIISHSAEENSLMNFDDGLLLSSFNLFSILSYFHPFFFRILLEKSFINVLFQIEDQSFNILKFFFQQDKAQEILNMDTTPALNVRNHAQVLDYVYCSLTGLFQKCRDIKLIETPNLLQHLFYLLNILADHNLIIFSFPLRTSNLLNLQYIILVQNEKLISAVIDQKFIKSLSFFIRLANQSIVLPCFSIISLIIQNNSNLGLFDVPELLKVVSNQLFSFLSMTSSDSSELFYYCIYILSIASTNPEFSMFVLSQPIISVVIQLFFEGNSYQTSALLKLLRQLFSIMDTNYIKALITETKIINKLVEFLDPDGDEDTINVLSCLNMALPVMEELPDKFKEFSENIEFDEIKSLVNSDNPIIASFAREFVQNFVKNF